MMRKRAFLFLLLLMLIALSVFAIAQWLPQQSPVTDWLLYFDRARERPGITAYNPATGEKRELPIYEETNTLRPGGDGIRPSGDGRITYIQDNDIWVLDVLNAPDSPVNITQTPDIQEWRIRWTPDRRFLQYQLKDTRENYMYDSKETTTSAFGYWNEQGLYAAVNHENAWFWYGYERIDIIQPPVPTDYENTWYVWNGQERIDITLPPLPDEPVWQKPQWTPDNHLFFTIGYQEQKYMGPIGPTDIFYWNGEIVREVDKPSDDETFMLGEWSADGRLLMYTSQRWYIWDGVSFTPDGIPDTSTLTPINTPGESIDDLAWMPDGRLAIAIRGDSESDTLLTHPFTCADPCVSQVYLWDSQSIEQLTSNDMTHGSFLVDVHENGSIAVSDFDGMWIGRVTVFDSTLQHVFQSSGFGSVSRWGADGSLSYCNGNDLFVWNGQESVQLSSSTYSEWLIASSWSMVCSTG